jgi:hypothetical protein
MYSTWNDYEQGDHGRFWPEATKGCDPRDPLYDTECVRKAYVTAESTTRNNIGTLHMFSTQIPEFDVSMTHIRLLPISHR